MGEYFTSGLICLQRNHLTHEYFVTFFFSRGGVVSSSPNPQAGGPPLVGCPRLLIQFIRSYPPYRRTFLHPQPEDAPCRGAGTHKHGLELHHILKSAISCTYVAVVSCIMLTGRRHVLTRNQTSKMHVKGSIIHYFSLQTKMKCLLNETSYILSQVSP